MVDEQAKHSEWARKSSTCSQPALGPHSQDEISEGEHKDENSEGAEGNLRRCVFAELLKALESTGRRSHGFRAL
ncbi:hypothetical protein Q2K19_10750 [Micromonospora soli]|uniref:hypothetical protein n=1 Tax=Micromonospora sp. NBRC 110009 TaxID=3061627 RepID=UPI0026723307|nr:hypothetical protein [Micromonospora sp. NBRC 110009]WKU00917.1 hypothetical protein Q2K19_10750 [Micromonospora sp. NBRC 110009]